ncbi:DUF6241 domain-containing protein [Oceanobacillus indicireducens]|uniref:CTP synthase n=1 Tax=Oceanobacillus indicireducens TaxID=1004261 RepID=A0A917Y008_9BACI|nr:DUF6241 domain-containing protein [Oceanobacillus indicireducens]GGN61023.1 hypothetical protein GCM10007971_25660 [Oceanobacillus indicireducens]
MNKLIWVLSTVAVVLFIGVGWYITSELSNVIKSEPDKVVEDLNKTKEDFITKENEQNPFGGLRTQKELTDDYYQDYIHKMSHQKIKADEKKGFYLITEERIDWLLEGLEVATVINKDVYHDILTRWKKGDFSQVDKDHNTIWEMQGGKVGKATGILMPEEEQRYIESQTFIEDRLNK